MFAAFPTVYEVGRFDLCSFLFVFGQLESDLLNSRLKGYQGRFRNWPMLVDMTYP